MEFPSKIRFSSLISDPEKYIEEMFMLHPDALHDKESGGIEIQNEIINSSFKYQLLERGLFLFSFSSYSPVDAEYEFVPNPKADYFTLVFYFTENRTKHPLYLKIEEQFYSTDQVSMFFNGEMNAEIFIKAKHKAYGIRLDIHKDWFEKELDAHYFQAKCELKEVLDFQRKGILQTKCDSFQPLVKSIQEKFEKKQNAFQKFNLKTTAYQLLQGYFEEIYQHSTTKNNEKDVADGELKSALNFLQKSLYKDFPGSYYLSELCKMSESSFNKKFKIAFKITSAQYFRNLKMKEALRLLQMGNTVKEVCHKIGYQDQSAFGRIFKQVYGKSPGSYMK